MTLDAEIMEIAVAVRSVAERQFPRRRRTLKNRCVCVSMALLASLNHAGKVCALVQGLYRKPGLIWPQHTWVEIAGSIVDLTLTQFVPAADPVSVRPVEDHHYLAGQRFDNANVIFSLARDGDGPAAMEMFGRVTYALSRPAATGVEPARTRPPTDVPATAGRRRTGVASSARPGPGGKRSDAGRRDRG